MKKVFRVVFELVLVLGIFLLAAQVIKKNKTIKAFNETQATTLKLNEELKNINKDYENSIISFRSSLNQIKEDYFNETDLFLLEVNSTEEAKEVLWKSIQAEEGKLPSHPTLGGKFYFSKGVPLKNCWYMAEVEDGHAFGRVLYRYSINENGNISWKIIDTYFD